MLASQIEKSLFVSIIKVKREAAASLKGLNYPITYTHPCIDITLS
jgi:hypothetical protein